MEFYGVLGEKLPHTMSPEIHSEIFKLLDLSGAYKIFEVKKEDLHNVAVSLKTLKIKGINVTIPYKQDIMKYLDVISCEAEKIGAVNTIYLKDNKLYGHNTDYFGFGTILTKNEVDINEKISMVLGTGGASKAVVHYLLDNNIKRVYLVSRSKKTISEYEDERVINVTYDEIKDIKGDIIINTTPVGMYPKTGVSPVNEEIIENFNVLVDVIYNPRLTEFLQIGKRLNKKICGGLEMLVGQAVKAEEIWQERSIDDKIIDNIFEKINKRFN